MLGLNEQGCIPSVGPLSSTELVEGTTPRMISRGLRNGKMSRLVASAHCSSLRFLWVVNMRQSGGNWKLLKTSWATSLLQIFRKEKDVVARLKPLENSVVRFPSLRLPRDGDCLSDPTNPEPTSSLWQRRIASRDARDYLHVSRPGQR